MPSSRNIRLRYVLPIAATMLALFGWLFVAQAQTSKYNNRVQTITGAGVPGAAITVCTTSGSLTPCGSPVTTATADAAGNYVITPAPGTYDIFVQANGFATFKYTQTISPDIAGVNNWLGADNFFTINGSCVVNGIAGGYALTDVGLQAALNTCKDVYIPANTTVILAAIVHMNTGNRILCGGWTAKIIQSSGLNPMIDYATNNASNTIISFCTLDGGSLSTAFGYLVSMGGSGQQNQLLYNQVQNFYATGAVVQIGGTQKYDTIMGNYFIQNSGATEVEIFYSSSGTVGGNRIQNNHFTNWGTWAIHVLRADKNNVSGNIMNGLLIKPNITVSGTNITWVSGPQFTGLLPGNGMRSGMPFGNGCVLATVTSATSATCVSAPGGGNFTNQIAAMGNFEMINVDTASYNDIAYNSGTGGEDNCVSVTNTIGGGPTNDNQLVGNHLGNCGGVGIGMDTTNGGNMFKNSIVSNYIYNVGQDPTPGNFNVGIRLASAGTQNNYIASNTIIDENSLMANPVAFDSVGAGNTLGDGFYSGETSLFPRSGFSNKTGQICASSPANPVVGTSYGTASVAFPFAITRLYGIVTGLGAGGSGNVTVNISESANVNPTSATVAVNSAVGTSFSSGASSPVIHAANAQMFIFTNVDNETTRTGWNVCAEYETQ